jgi:hypothetical protein
LRRSSRQSAFLGAPILLSYHTLLASAEISKHLLATTTNGTAEHVRFTNVLGNPTLQAFVTVRHSDANSTLDVYAFDKIPITKPVQLFKMQGLVKGDAKISYCNSILTAEVDQNSTLNAGKSSGQWTPTSSALL